VRAVIVAHNGPPAPADVWSAWHPDPLVVGGLLLLAWAYWRGRSRNRIVDAWPAWCFTGGLVALAVALLSPLDAISGALASAHMVQHLLLTLVAAPLLAASAPAGALLRGGPAAVRSAVTPWRRRLRLTGSATHALRHPGTVWLLHVAMLWLWHTAVLYGAALEHRPVHALEHATFLGTAVLFWRVVVGTRASRVSPGIGVLMVFGMMLQSALLALLLTFARQPWYSGYTTTTRPWGLEQLADQNLAGAIMWVPAGLVYLGVALTLLVGWVRGTEEHAGATTVEDVPVVPALLAHRS
jgi:putative membrane protein